MRSLFLSCLASKRFNARFDAALIPSDPKATHVSFHNPERENRQEAEFAASDCLLHMQYNTAMQCWYFNNRICSTANMQNFEVFPCNIRVWRLGGDKEYSPVPPLVSPPTLPALQRHNYLTSRSEANTMLFVAGRGTFKVDGGRSRADMRTSLDKSESLTETRRLLVDTQIRTTGP